MQCKSPVKYQQPLTSVTRAINFAAAEADILLQQPHEIFLYIYIGRAALGKVSSLVEVGSLLADTKGGFIFVRATKISIWGTGELQSYVS